MTTSLEDEILDKFECRTIKQLEHLSTSGCVNTGNVYLLDNERKIFVKKNNDPVSDLMFSGEFSSLETILNTNTVKVPKPLALITDPETNLPVIVMEYIDNLTNLKEHEEKLGESLANLHRDNYIKIRRLEKAQSWIGKEKPDAVDSYGFEVTTCCGQIPQENEWNSNWIEFYSRNKIDYQIKLILEQYTDRVMIEEWSKLQLKIDKLFLDENEDQIKLYPALLHGDLWIGNLNFTLSLCIFMIY